MQPVSADVEEPDGTYYEYDRNLKATVKVTPDGERTPVAGFEHTLGVAAEGPHKTTHEAMHPEPAEANVVFHRGPLGPVRRLL